MSPSPSYFNLFTKKKATLSREPIHYALLATICIGLFKIYAYRDQTKVVLTKDQFLDWSRRHGDRNSNADHTTPDTAKVNFNVSTFSNLSVEFPGLLKRIRFYHEDERTASSKHIDRINAEQLSNEKGQHGAARRTSNRFLTQQNATEEYYLRPLANFESENEDPVYGTSLSMSDDGKTLAAVGSVTLDSEDSGYYRGYSEVYDVATGNILGSRIYTETGEAHPTMDIELSGDGLRLAVATVHPQIPESVYSPSSGVQVYELIDEGDLKTWSPLGAFIEAGLYGDFPGLSVSMSHEGSRMIIGRRNFAEGRGCALAYEFDYNSKAWTETANILGEAAGDNEASSVSITSVGDHFATGATGYDANEGIDQGSVKVFDIEGSQIGNVIIGEGAGDFSGHSVSIVQRPGTSMLRLAVGATHNDPTESAGDVDAGHVRVFEIDLSQDTEWRKLGNDIDGDYGVTLDYSKGEYHIGDYFGFSIDLNLDGSRLAVGAPFYSHSRISDYYYGNVKLFEYTSDLNLWSPIVEDMIGSTKDTAAGYSIVLANLGENEDEPVKESVVAIGNLGGEKSGEDDGDGDGDSGGSIGIRIGDEKSNQPSSQPSLSKSPSISPSSYSDRTFKIRSSYYRFEDLAGSNTMDWCIETTTITPGSTLKVRPCDNASLKQRWYHEDGKIKLRDTIQVEFCMKDEADQLTLQKCEDVSSTFTFEPLGGIMVTRNNRRWFVVVDSVKIFSRIRLSREEFLNGISDSWEVAYENKWPR